jgi:hypothetical protein
VDEQVREMSCPVPCVGIGDHYGRTARVPACAFRNNHKPDFRSRLTSSFGLLPS